ncbi:MAG TPA: hypothetical protein VHB77_15330 [Planctomycetaceae bacterium]|nr:hypothetical protein [Planctomycetaceae bacterium]
MLRNLSILLTLAIALSAGGWFVYQWRYENVETYERQCSLYNAKGKWPQLAAVAEKWSRREPQKADPWLFRAVAAEGLEDWPAAVEYLDRVPRDDPRAVPALVRKAIAEFEQLNRPWDGVKTCDEVLRIEPRVLIAHKQVIFFFATTLQRAEMVRRIREAIRLRRESPESYIYLVSASWLYSGSLYRHNTHWLEGDPDSQVFRVAQAMPVYTSQAKSDRERAAEFEHIPPPEQLLERYPHNLELLAYFLSRSITDGDLERVQQLLEAVPPAVGDADARVWRARAWCADTLGDSDGAEQALRRALAIDPYWWQLHFQLHDLLRRLGRAEEAARELEIYKVSHEISIKIMTMNRTEERFDDPEFSGSLVELAELVKDEEVVAALKERVSPP